VRSLRTCSAFGPVECQINRLGARTLAKQDQELLAALEKLLATQPLLPTFPETSPLIRAEGRCLREWCAGRVSPYGALEDLEAVMARALTAPWQLFRQGAMYPSARHPQPRNVLLLSLAEWERGYAQGTAAEHAAILADEEQQLRGASAALTTLAALSRAGIELAHVQPQIVLSTVRPRTTGAFSSPRSLSL
jgi:hypothetical protein